MAGGALGGPVAVLLPGNEVRQRAQLLRLRARQDGHGRQQRQVALKAPQHLSVAARLCLEPATQARTCSGSTVWKNAMASSKGSLL